jgi:hypothetical protein
MRWLIRTLPTSACFNALTRLRDLDLSQNALVAANDSGLNALCTHAVRALSLRYCIDCRTHRALLLVCYCVQSVEFVDVSHNALNGSLCAAFSAPKLTYFAARNNSLTRALPTSLESSTALVRESV